MTRYCSTNKQIVSKPSTLNPWWVTGFVDAEGCFKALQYSAWLKVVYLLSDQVRTDIRNIELERLIKELSCLK